MFYTRQKTNLMPVENSIDQTKSNSGTEGGKHSDFIDAKVNAEVISNFSNSQKDSGMPKSGGDAMR